MPLQDPEIPRHQRMFELLRQDQMAQDTQHRLKTDMPAPPEVTNIEQFQKHALQSLRPVARS